MIKPDFDITKHEWSLDDQLWVSDIDSDPDDTWPCIQFSLMRDII